jgi:hypothetical protein
VIAAIKWIYTMTCLQLKFWPDIADNDLGELCTSIAAILDSVNTDQPIASVHPRDRRRVRRFICDGRVEINRIPSTGKRLGKLKDLSQHGCCIEIDKPFAVPSYVEVMIDTRATRLRLTGTVKSSREAGIGIEFDQISTTGRRLLQDLIHEMEQNPG